MYYIYMFTYKHTVMFLCVYIYIYKYICIWQQAPLSLVHISNLGYVI